MSVTSLMNQTITKYVRSSYNSQGREVLGSGTSVRARIQAKKKNILLPNGTVFTIDALVFVPCNTIINVDDKVTFDSQNYKVYAKYPAIDGMGNTSHLELQLVKWQI